ADERRGAGDRQAPEAVEDALVDVGVEVHADRDAAHGDRLGEDAGQQELQVVVLRAAGDRAAEDVGEQQQEDDRLGRDVGERLGRAQRRDEAAAGEHQAVAQEREPARAGRRGGGGGGDGDRGHAATAGRSSWWVRAKKTSSRLGSRSDSSITAMPASSRRRTAAPRAASSATGALTTPRPGESGAVRAMSSTIARTSSIRVGSSGRTVSVWPPTTRLSPSGVSCAMTRPWSMTVISSASASASSRYCVVRRTVEPSSTSERTTLHMSSRLAGSRPVVGSSRKTTAGRPTRL